MEYQIPKNATNLQSYNKYYSIGNKVINKSVCVFKLKKIAKMCVCFIYNISVLYINITNNKKWYIILYI